MTWPQQEEDLAGALDEAPFADRLTRLNLGRARKTAKVHGLLCRPAKF